MAKRALADAASPRRCLQLLLLLRLAGAAAVASWLKDSTALLQSSQQAQQATRRDGDVYHLHIPRTGGTSFIADAQRVLGENMVSHEGCYDWRVDFPGISRVATMLRSPREHVLSQYLYCSEGHISFMTQVPKRNFAEWVEAWSGFQAEGKIVGDYSHGGSLQSEHVIPTYVTFTDLPFKCYNPTDLQVQRLTCERPFKYPKESDTEQAIMNMQETWFVGLLEAYQESLCLLYAKTHFKLPVFCDCTDSTKWSSFNQTHTAYHKHTTRTSHNVTDHPKKVWQAVDQLTAGDRMLYKAAVQRFVFEVHEIEREFKTKILCYDTLLIQRSLKDPMRMHFAMYLRDAKGSK